MCSALGERLRRWRSERVERAFAHVYETGGMRRTHLRGHANILKRLLIHVAGFNLSLVLRKLYGVGTPRALWFNPLAPQTPLSAGPLLFRLDLQHIGTSFGCCLIMYFHRLIEAEERRKPVR